jgi:hypothetical protein
MDDDLSALSLSQLQKYGLEYRNPNPVYLTQRPETTTPASAVAETRAIKAAHMTPTERRGYRAGYLAGSQANGRAWRKLCGAIGRSLRHAGGPTTP